MEKMGSDPFSFFLNPFFLKKGNAMRPEKWCLTPFKLFRLFFAACFLVLAASAHAFPVNQCAADRAGWDLGCTAMDVQITGMAVVGDTRSCVGGTTTNLDLQMTMNFGQPDRYDIGVFIANDGKDPGVMSTGGGAATCSVSVLPTASPFLNLDGPTDTCGDGNGSIGGGTGSGIHYMTSVPVKCQSEAGAGGNLYIPFVVSWDQQASPTGGMCNSNADPVPGTKSKCNSPTVVQGSVAVVVVPAITMTDGKTTLSSGDATSYTIIITNTTGATLGGIVFTDPLVTGIAANSLSCSAAGGASCPASSTVAAMQGAGITIPTMPVGGSVTFTVNAILTGNPGDSRTNTAYATVGGQSNSASDSDTIVSTIAILPVTQAKSGVKSSVIPYTYTLWNFGASTDTITLAAVSSKGWTVALSPTSITLAAGASATFTLNVTIKPSAAVGDVDTTTMTATSGNDPSKTATAKAITTATTVLTLTPSNKGNGGPGASVYYTHRVQNNDSSRTSISLANVLAGTCSGWTSALYQSDKATPLASPATVAVNGGFLDFVLKVTIPTGATVTSSCTATLTAAYASGAASSVSVTDVTTVKRLLLYQDPGYTTEQYTYPTGNNVYAKTYGLTNGTPYYYKWLNPSGTVLRTSPITSNLVALPDTYTIPDAGPLGTWTIQLWNNSTNTIFEQSNFYVGPDHLSASTGFGSTPQPANIEAVVNLALHGKNHSVPLDASGNLVKGGPTDPKDPLMVTVTVGGSASIVSTTLANATIVGQTVTGRLDSVTGTATLSITDSVGETVTVTPASYNSVLYGSSLSPTRDHGTTVIFAASVDHYELSLPSSSITCLPTTVTVTACTDNSNPCTGTATSISGNATLSTTAGTLSSPVTLTSGVGTASLSYPTAPDGTAVTVSVVTVPTAAGNAATCRIGAGCTTTFNKAGFIFSSAAGGGGATIASQVAGMSSGTYYLRAVKTLDNSSHTCGAAFTGATTVNFGYECNNPTTCYGSNLMAVNGGTSTTIARNNNGSVSSYTPVNMTFDASGNAPFAFGYGDVGQVKLWASKTVNSASLIGSSNSFVVKPYGFKLTNFTCAVADDPSTAAGHFCVAGGTFTATVTSASYDNTKPNNLGGVTPSFGQEAPAQTVTFAPASLVNPTTAAGGTLPGFTSSSTGGFSNATYAATATMVWPEVGSITIQPNILNYLGTGDITAGGRSDSAASGGNAGRFYPHHFALTGGAVTASCGGAAGFTYMDQPNLGVSFTVEAQNKASVKTANYFYAATGGYPVGAVNLAAENNNAGIDLIGRISGIAASVWTAANGYVVNATGASFSRLTAPDGTYDALAIGAKVSDPDGASFVGKNMKATTANDCTAVPDCDAVQLGSATRVRFGRVRLSNAFGSEKSSLPVAVQAQYWSGNSWVINGADGCTSLPANIFALSGALAANTSASAVALVGGSGTLTLAKPNPAATGSVDVAVNLGAGGSDQSCLSTHGGAAGGQPWLRSRNGNCAATYDRDPSARATFGIYSPETKKTIHVRELY